MDVTRAHCEGEPVTGPAGDLLERAHHLATLHEALAATRAGRGTLVLLSGDAGAGKTTLLRHFCAAGGPAAEIRWGSCDPLHTPRPLGPLRDVAGQVGGPFARAVADGSREDVLAAALDELAARAVVVVEDLHWADDGTLDLVALLGRRLVRSPGCLILTCRTEAVAERPEVRRVLAALPRECVVRVAPEPLSETAVALLAERAGRDATDLHAVSGGNPFYVTEVLAAAADDGVPASVRDAVALRVDGVSPPARAVVELAAVVPGATELWLLGGTVGADAGAIDECIAAGLLALRGDTVAFRNDLARRAVEDGLSSVRRRELDGLVLDALAAAGDADPARLAHHARRAGRVDAIRRLAPAAARAASRSGGHHQALEHWEAALAAEEGADPAVRAEALEGVAVEAYLCGHMARAIEARRGLLAIHEAAADALRAGDDLR